MLAQNTSGSVSNDDLHFVIDSTMIVFPDVLSDAKAKGVSWSQDIKVTMSSVSFTPTIPGCTSSCIYVAKTV